MGYVVASAIVIGALAAAMPAGMAVFSGGVIDDSADSYVVFGLVLVAVPAVVYLLSRRPAGMAVLVLAATIALGTIQFLYRGWVSSQPGTAVALFVYGALAALFVNRAYRR